MWDSCDVMFCGVFDKCCDILVRNSKFRGKLEIFLNSKKGKPKTKDADACRL